MAFVKFLKLDTGVITQQQSGDNLQLQNLDVLGNLTVSGSEIIVGSTTFQGQVNIGDSVDDLVTITSSGTNLTSAGALTLGSTLSAAGITDTTLTANLLVATDGSKALTSVSDLTSWIASAGPGTNITVTDDTDGTITLDTIQGISSSASPTFTGLTLTSDIDIQGNLAVSGTVTGIDHGQLDGLADDDHPQYLLADGTRKLTGDWNVGNYDLTVGGDITTSGTLIASGGNPTLEFSATSGTIGVSGDSNLIQISSAGDLGSHSSDFYLDSDVTAEFDGTVYFDGWVWGTNISGTMYGDGSNLTGIVNSWIDLTDTDPASYAGQGGKLVQVNSGETGLDFTATPTVSGLTSLGNVDVQGNLTVSGTVTGSIDHGQLTGLSDDDHTQYLLADGTRKLTGDWNAGDYDITAGGDITASGSLVAGGTGSSVLFSSTSGTIGVSGNADLITLNSGTGDYNAVIVDGYFISDYNTDAGEWTGFVNRSDSTISFDDGSRTFTISGTSYDYYDTGVKYNKTGADTVQITDTEGLWYIYYSGETLTASQSLWDLSTDVLTAFVYWDATNNSAILFGDERHGMQMDGATHEYLHKTINARYESGFQISGTVSGTGGNNLDAQIGITNGYFWDEDIRHSVIHDAAPDAQFEQVLSLPAELPVYYLNGASAYWRKTVADTYPLYDNVGTGRIGYNKDTAGTWSVAEVTDSYYAISWIFVTNNVDEPVVVILGQGEYATEELATEASFGDMTLTNFPFAEAKILYKVIYQTDDTYANAVKARQVVFEDYRTGPLAPATAFTATSHTSLTDLDYSVAGHTNFMSLNTEQTVTADKTWSGADILTASSGTNNIGSASVPFASVYADDVHVKGSSLYVGGVTITEDTDLVVDANIKYPADSGIKSTYASSIWISMGGTVGDTKTSFRNYDGTEVGWVDDLGNASFLTISGTIISDESVDHGSLGGLTDDDHTQYILADASRKMTGDWNMGDYDLTVGQDFTASGTITAGGTSPEIQFSAASGTIGVSGDDDLVHFTVDTVAIRGALGLNTGTTVNEFSIDGTMAGNSDDAVPTEQAVVEYVATVTGTLGTALQNYADAGDSSTLSSAQSYADSGDTSTYNSATSYTDTQIATLSGVYVKQDGTTPLTGNWDVGNFDITIGGGLNVTGAVDFDGGATISGATTFDDTVTFNSTATGQTPTLGAHLATKAYVDSIAGAPVEMTASGTGVTKGYAVYPVGNDTVDHADKDDSSATKVIGLAQANTALGETATIQSDGVLAGAGAGWTAGDRLYLGDSGALTTTPPSTVGDYVLLVGIAVNATDIFIKIGDAVLL